MSFLSKIFGNKEPKEKGYDFYGTLRVCPTHKVLKMVLSGMVVILEGDDHKCATCKYQQVDEAKALKIMKWTGDEVWTGVYRAFQGRNPVSLNELERKIVKDCESHLGLITEKQELEYFEKVTTKDSREATRILFEHALAAVPVIQPQKAKFYFDSVKGTFGSKVLVEGSKDKVQETVMRNLQRLAASRGFYYFSIDALAKDECAQVNVVYQREFVPFRVWKSKDRFFACGDPDFK